MVQSTPRKRGKSPLAHWFNEITALEEARVQFRLRGNNLHILCETDPAPDQSHVLSHLLPALQQVNLNDLVPPDQPEIYQVFVYGRVAQQHRPEWTTAIDLSQIDHHLEQFQQMQLEALAFNGSEDEDSSDDDTLLKSEAIAPLASPPSSLLSHSEPPEADRTDVPTLPSAALSPAQRGNLEAIARYLGESLSHQNIAVQVRARTIPLPTRTRRTPRSLNQRLWVTCEATYSPAPSLVAEPMAQQLRALNLEGFQDAIVVIQVRGEATPDWLLRVDLTPADAMLQEWGQWGDVQAITRLLSRALSHKDLTISTASLRDETLHLFCSQLSNVGSSFRSDAIAPLQETVTSVVSPILTQLAPQGIQAAMIYGQPMDAETPSWVFWLDLPATQAGNRSDSTMNRARRGDWGAIAFLLNRLLNPDLDQQLATGGTRIQLLPKPDREGGTLLHIMSDAPNCPAQTMVATTVERFLRELNLTNLTGARIYGRRAGQKQPLWSQGIDFRTRTRLVPEAIPEFAASDAYVSELIAPSDERILRPDLTAADIQNGWSQWRDRSYQGMRRLLLQTHLFVPGGDVPLLSGTMARPGWALAFVWGAAGLLLAVQADWGLARLLPAPLAAEASLGPEHRNAPAPSVTAPSPGAHGAGAHATTKAKPTDKPEPEVFRRSSFINGDRTTPEAESDLPYTPIPVQSQLSAATILAKDSPYPTFNSPQIDEKLLLYYERIKQQVAASDVLIIGSSRAMRGVDPMALQQELATLGYKDVTVFNFGINGATAQVADLLLNQLLTPEQLPKLVIWADGARALNSSTVDVTFNGIAVSPGYRDLRAGRLERPTLIDSTAEAESSAPETAPTGITASLSASYEAIDRQVSQTLGHFSAVYSQRDRLKAQFQATIAALLPDSWVIPARATQLDNNPAMPPESLISLSEQGRDLVDFDGFLPISLRFNPATYYQDYARVAGRYDGDYLNFRLAGIQTEALRKLLQTMKGRKIPVVFVNLPLTDEYLDSDRQKYEQQFRQFMVKQANEQPTLVFRDLSEIWPENYDYFSDPSHLNRYGAYEVSRRLAQDPMIPWDLLKPKAKPPTPSTSPTPTQP